MSTKQEEWKDTNPKDAVGSMKLPLSLWPMSATAMGCIGMLNGMLKYGRQNVRKLGIRTSVYIDALLRHIFAYMEGQEIDECDECKGLDPESEAYANKSCVCDGVHHLSAGLACIGLIVEARALGNLIDDRSYRGEGYIKLVNELTPHVKRLKALHAEKSPQHYDLRVQREEELTRRLCLRTVAIGSGEPNRGGDMFTSCTPELIRRNDLIVEGLGTSDPDSTLGRAAADQLRAELRAPRLADRIHGPCAHSVLPPEDSKNPVGDSTFKQDGVIGCDMGTESLSTGYARVARGSDGRCHYVGGIPTPFTREELIEQACAAKAAEAYTRHVLSQPSRTPELVALLDAEEPAADKDVDIETELRRAWAETEKVLTDEAIIGTAPLPVAVTAEKVGIENKPELRALFVKELTAAILSELEDAGVIPPSRPLVPLSDATVDAIYEGFGAHNVQRMPRGAVLSRAELAERVCAALVKCDGDIIERIANQVLSPDDGVSYLGFGSFEVTGCDN